MSATQGPPEETPGRVVGWQGQMADAGWQRPAGAGVGWQGQVPPPAAPVLPPYRSAVGRARWLYTSMAAFTIVSLVSLWLEVDQLSLLDRLLAGDRFELGAVALSRDALDVVYVTESVAYIAVVIVFLGWLVRANRNLLAFGLPRKHGTKGVLGWWFVPFANLVQPYRVVSEVVHKSTTERDAPTLLMYTWWATWIISEFIGFRLGFFGFEVGSYQEFRDETLFVIVTDALLLVTGLALAMIVWWATRAQERRAVASVAPVDGPIEQPKTDTGRTVWAVLSVAGLGLLVLVLAGPVQAGLAGFVGRPTEIAGSGGGGEPGSRVSIYDLAVGDCFTDVGADIIWALHLSECAKPHVGEAFDRFRHPSRSSEAYPGDEAMEEFAWDACLRRFTDAIGEPYDTSPLAIWYFLPDQLSWSVGHRDITCVAVHWEGELLEGSDLHGAPPSPGVIPSVGRHTASRP